MDKETHNEIEAGVLEKFLSTIIKIMVLHSFFNSSIGYLKQTSIIRICGIWPISIVSYYAFTLY